MPSSRERRRKKSIFGGKPLPAFAKLNSFKNLIFEMGKVSNSKNSKNSKKVNEPKLFRPNIDSLGKNEELNYDSSAYLTMHQLETKLPSLSFDVLDQQSKGIKTSFPAKVALVAGSQAPKNSQNKISLYEVTNLCETVNDERESSEDSEDKKTENERNAIVREIYFEHPGAINRIRAMPQDRRIVASWSENSKVYFWDLKKAVQCFEDPKKKKKFKNGEMEKLTSHFGSIDSHKAEGFSLSWNGLDKGVFLSGDTNGDIILTRLEILEKGKKGEKFGFSSSAIPDIFSAHNGSVEDIQWSPSEPTVFASCSTDKDINIWDTRLKRNAPAVGGKNMHSKDINVISWNTIDTKLLASGSDDCSFKVWDLRFFERKSPSALYKWHRGPVTALEWSPFDESVLTLTSEDDTATMWDLSLEEDLGTNTNESSLKMKIPPQLMFVHMGQKEIKETHFHTQHKKMIITTALNGFNIFIPENMAE